MKKRKGIGMLGLAFLGITLASCGTVGSKTTTTTKAAESSSKTTTQAKVEDKSFVIRAYDYDGTEILNESLSTKNYSTVQDALVAKDSKYQFYAGGQGTFVTSIAGSLVDPNYYVAIYENNALASTGVDGLVIDNGDVFEFKVECWNTISSGYGTMDEVDLLVDQAIYYYAKNTMPEKLKNETTYNGSAYWEYAAIHLMQSMYYDANIFNTSYISSAVKTTVSEKDVTALSGAEFAKWYYAARLYSDISLDAFKTSYEAYLEAQESYTSEYVLPFTLSIAKGLGLDNKISDAVKNTEYRAGVGYGPDGLAWQVTGLALYQNLADTELAPFTYEALASSFSADTSLSSYLLAYAAMNKNPREAKSFDGKDMVQYLMDTYYDKEAHQFATEKLGTGDYSSNQIYAALMAYKAWRDQTEKKAVILFA